MTFFAFRFWAGCIISISGFDLRQAQPLPHGPGRRCEAAGASSYDHLGWRASIQSGDLPKKTAPVRARVCAVIVEDSHRLKGGGDACAQWYLTTSQSVEQIHFHLAAASVGGLLHSRYAGRAERPRHSSPGWPPVREKPPGSGRMRRRGDQTEMQFAEVSSYVRLDLPSLRRQSRPKDCSTSPSNPMMGGALVPIPKTSTSLQAASTP